MTGLILHIIKSTLYLSVFYAFFMLVMRKTTFFRLNRSAFIIGTFLCMALPFVDIRLPEQVEMNMPMTIIENALISQESEPIMLDGAVVSGSDSAEQGRKVPFIGIIFMVGAIISFLITARSYMMMRKMIKSAKTTDIDGMPVRITEAEIPSFSWGRHIVINRKDLEENPSILTHERMHVRCMHSTDLMAYTIVTTLHWFNPLVWIARTELKMLHEYEADELTINQGIDATQYQLLLVMKSVGAKRFQLANGFNHSKLKNRITMMHKNKTNKWMRLTYILCVPALILTMCFCSNPKTEGNDEIRFDGLSVSALSPKAKAEFKDFSAAEFDEFIKNCGDDPKFIIVDIHPCDNEEVVKRFRDYLNQKEILLVNPPEAEGQTAASEEEYSDKEPVPFQLVDEKPTFQGGDANKFSQWVNSNMNYPDEAKEKGIQGRVTLSFTVSSSGKVHGVKVLRGVDPILDNEAVRVVEMSPEWTPGKSDGKPVSVSYTFPVIFKLK